VGVSRDCPISFGYPLLSQEQVKLRTSNFVATFTGSIGTKAHENVGNDGRGRISPENFQGTHMYRGHLCDSTAFLLYCTMQPLSGSSSTLKRMTLNDLEWSFCVKIWSELGIQWVGVLAFGENCSEICRATHRLSAAKKCSPASTVCKM